MTQTKGQSGSPNPGEGAKPFILADPERKHRSGISSDPNPSAAGAGVPHAKWAETPFSKALAVACEMIVVAKRKKVKSRKEAAENKRRVNILAEAMMTLFRIRVGRIQWDHPYLAKVPLEDVVQECCGNFWKHTVAGAVLRDGVRKRLAKQYGGNLPAYLAKLVAISTRQRLMRMTVLERRQRGCWDAPEFIPTQSGLDGEQNWWERMLDVASLESQGGPALCPMDVAAALTRAGGGQAMEAALVAAAAEFFAARGHEQTANSLQEGLQAARSPATSRRSVQRRCLENKRLLRESMEM